ncbi:MAG: hypothetical protein K2J83_06030 [Clostridia bacterium]|nr:hypothetical protein [Clostridia bacterium]
MPDYFSHGVCAEIIYEKLQSKYKNKIKNKTLYLLGAQGGDVFFAYNIKPTKSNLGRSMHRMDAQTLFEKLVSGNPSYVAGFATHYALDCTLHPKIYAYEHSHRSPFAHIKFENDLGLYISKKFKMRRTIIPREKLLACTGAVYDTVKKVEPLITVTGVERCLKRHFTYSKFLYRFKRQNYKCVYNFSTASDDIDKSIELGITAVKSVLDGEAPREIFNKKFLQN